MLEQDIKIIFTLAEAVVAQSVKRSELRLFKGEESCNVAKVSSIPSRGVGVRKKILAATSVGV